jgi:hypothetical protein
MSFRRTTGLTVAVLLSYSLTSQAQSSEVSAQTDAPAAFWDRSVAAPRKALELTLSTSLVAGLGQATDPANRHVAETVDSGTSFQLGVGYRVAPNWALGITSAYEHYDKGPTDSSATTPQGAVARADLTYHFSPNSRTDSWLSGGTGSRWLHESDASGSVHDFYGFELARLAAGLDLRVAPRVAFGPAVGADVNALLWDGSHLSADQHLSVFWYLGVQVRVDLAGNELSANSVALR